MAAVGIGDSAPRLEDAALITGRGRFTDDLCLPGQAYAVFLRSPHAHARIRSLDAEPARRGPGVLAVYTYADLAAAGLGTLPHLIPLKQSDGSPVFEPPRPALADGCVRHIGDAVACIVAESVESARAAADRVAVDYQVLPAVTETAGADLPGAPQVWPAAARNLCFEWELGDRCTVEETIDSATHVVSLDLINNRVTAAALEPRCAIAYVEAETGRLVLQVGSQGVHTLRRQLAKDIFRIPEDQIRVVTGDVGGGFGMKFGLYPEYVLVLLAARDLNRPVKWTATRAESFCSDSHGRDHLTRAELALDETGRFLALRVDTLANLGAYLSSLGAFVPSQAGSRMLAGCYTLPAVHVRVRGVFTHAGPVDAYRGAGRPEAIYCLERLVDKAARLLGYDPATLRRRNFIPPESMPYTTATGLTYDSGDFAQTLNRALDEADAAGFESRRDAARERGRLRGLGLATYVEAAAGGPAEQARIDLDGHGQATVMIGTQSTGQGHATAYRQIIAETLGLAAQAVTVLQGDSDRVTSGGGTVGSRSIPVGAAALAEAARTLIASATPAAAAALATPAADVRFQDGAFRSRGTNRFVTLAALAARQSGPPDQPVFSGQARWRPPAPTFPNGTHVCEIEIDPDTGVAEIVRYTVVDDCGTILNPALLTGQIRGGVVQGIGQALFEQIVYTGDSVRLLTGDFATYCLPRAENVPTIDVVFAGTPCRTNPLGLKGAGEAGTIGAPPAVINGVVDALAGFGVTHINMPATPERLRRLIARHA